MERDSGNAKVQQIKQISEIYARLVEKIKPTPVAHRQCFLLIKTLPICERKHSHSHTKYYKDVVCDLVDMHPVDSE